ncbi:protein-disulfide reductase DsbD family protein [Variovorax boronicumulans]|uniref:protein-disulfide reductase DsbD family protein n=1 Tax=Variovorax boronicumulans TaxID=436515 RepID=UPI001C56F40E
MLRSLLSSLSRLPLAALALAAALPVAAQLTPRVSSVVTTPHVRAELVALAPDGVDPGATVWLGLQIAHQPEWHTYWKNAGDSGLPTELQWTLPAGLTAGDVAWPVPKKIPIGNLANYGYEHTVLLPVPVTVAPGFTAAAGLTGAAGVDVKLKASWLVCRKECIPEEGEFALRLPAQGSTALHKADFDAAFAAQPAPLAPAGAIEVAGQTIKVRLDGLPPAARGKTLEFFPETGEVIHTAAVAGRDWTQAWQGDSWTATLPLAEQRSASPTVMPVVVALAEADRVAGAPVAWRAEAPVTGTWAAVAPPAQVSPALQAALAANAAAPVPSPVQTSNTGFFAALLGALLGGLLLNLMPCVFPVLAIKVLAFANQAGDRRGHRTAGLAYTAGVMLTFLALGAAMLALRAAGEQLGWGFQLQSPAVIAALAALFTLIGLNLAGVFEFGLLAPRSLCAAQVKHPIANDFLSGILAVVIASPCTAPFMGASLGIAIALPAPQALMLFAALGLGLALPYLLAGFVPAVARLLPRPGAWMDTLRRVMAFPMFATVAWLVWVLGQQSGIDGAGALLGLLVCLAAVVWSLTLRGRTRWVVGGVLLACSAAMAVAIGGNVVRPIEPATVAAAAGARWQPWSAARVAELHAAGRPVFIDFTAAWCVTCQYNKKTTLNDAALLAEFDRRQVAMLRADWTRQDPAITAALNALGRSGVPVYVLQAPGKPPVVLTEILSKDDVRAALTRL